MKLRKKVTNTCSTQCWENTTQNWVRILWFTADKLRHWTLGFSPIVLKVFLREHFAIIGSYFLRDATFVVDV